MRTFIKQKLNSIKQGLYGESLLTSFIIIDRLKYSNRGRPKKSDYITLIEAQKRINEYNSMILHYPKLNE